MENARKFLQLTDDQSESVSRLVDPAHSSRFYDEFALNGIRVEPGVVVCTFKVPPCLIGRDGKLANGAIADILDVVGGAAIHVEGLPMNVSVDMSISFLSTAKLDDELEITARVLGQRGRYSGTVVVLKSKATGEIIVEGRHSLFRQRISKI